MLSRQQMATLRTNVITWIQMDSLDPQDFQLFNHMCSFLFRDNFRTGENYNICTAFNKRHGFPVFFQSCSSYSVCLSQTLTAHVSHSLSTPGWLCHLCSVHSWLTKIQHVLEEKKGLLCRPTSNLQLPLSIPHPAQTGPSLWEQAVRRKPSQHDGKYTQTIRRTDC